MGTQRYRVSPLLTASCRRKDLPPLAHDERWPSGEKYGKWRNSNVDSFSLIASLDFSQLSHTQNFGPSAGRETWFEAASRLSSSRKRGLGAERLRGEGEFGQLFEK